MRPIALIAAALLLFAGCSTADAADERIIIEPTSSTVTIVEAVGTTWVDCENDLRIESEVGSGQWYWSDRPDELHDFPDGKTWPAYTYWIECGGGDPETFTVSDGSGPTR